MLAIHRLGLLGELKVQHYFVEQGYQVYSPLDLHDPYDLVVYREGIFSRVSVRTTASEQGDSWMVDIRSGHNSQNGFDTTIDLLVIYVAKEDRVVVYNAKEITNKRGISIPKLSEAV